MLGIFEVMHGGMSGSQFIYNLPTYINIDHSIAYTVYLSKFDWGSDRPHEKGLWSMLTTVRTGHDKYCSIISISDMIVNDPQMLLAIMKSEKDNIEKCIKTKND